MLVPIITKGKGVFKCLGEFLGLVMYVRGVPASSAGSAKARFGFTGGESKDPTIEIWGGMDYNKTEHMVAFLRANRFAKRSVLRASFG